MAAFLKQPWSIKKSSLCTIWEINLETSEKLFSMIQSGCSIYSHFLKPLHWNIHELWHKAPIVMKITVHSIRVSKWTLHLLFVFLKLSNIFFLICSLFLPIFFLIFHNRNDLYITPEIGVIIQRKLRKKKRPVLMIMLEESDTWMSNVQQANKWDVVIKKLSYVKVWELS